MKLTFDNNCLIDLERSEHDYSFLQQLVNWHDNNDITIYVSAIQASERKLDKTYVATFSEFQKRVEQLSKRPFEILLPPAYVGIAYIGYCIVGTDRLERQIHEVLFPKTPFEWNGTSKNDNKAWVKWRNKKCDVLALWCHIRNSGDIFVTGDTEFHKQSKRHALEKLGAKSYTKSSCRCSANQVKQLIRLLWSLNLNPKISNHPYFIL